MDEEARRRSRSFGEDAAAYDRTRPSYPSALLDDLLAGRDPTTTRVLDVGCGTGKVGALFDGRGCSVLGIEPDERMAEVARGHGLTVEVAPFETWDAGSRTFDLVVSGQAWHWVDPVVGPHRAAAVLPTGGRLAVFWNQSQHREPMRTELHEIYATFPELRGSVALGLRSERTPIDEIDACGAFGRQDVVVHRWSVTHTTEEWLDQLPTHSDHRLLPPDRLADLLPRVGAAIDATGGTLTLDYDTVCWTAERLAG